MKDAPSLLEGEQKANTLWYALAVSEGRKRVLWICATILAARKLAQIDKPCPALESCIADAISRAEIIMRRIDSRWPAANAELARKESID